MLRLLNTLQLLVMVPHDSSAPSAVLKTKPRKPLESVQALKRRIVSLALSLRICSCVSCSCHSGVPQRDTGVVRRVLLK
jgi:hypothetical protein